MDYSDFGILVGRHLTALPTLADTQLSELQLDDLGRLIIAGRWLEDSAHVSGDSGLFALGVRDDGVFATGTVTVVDYTQLSGDTLTVDGNALVEGVDWTAATSNSATATSLASAINALASVNAVAVGAVITITAASRGAAGNLISLVTTDAVNLTISGSNLSGGADNTVWTSDHGDYSPIAVDQYGRVQVVAAVTVEPSDAEFHEDAPNASGDVGLHVLTVRQDTLATSTSANGDYADFKVNALGELYTHDTSANASLTTISSDISSILTEVQGLSYAEDSAHTTGDMGTMALGVRNDTYAAQTSTDLDYGAINLDSAGRVGIRGSFAEDSAAASGNDLISVGSVRQDTLAISTSADGDYAHIKSNDKGEVYVVDKDGNASLDNIELYLLNQQHAEDAPHVSGDIGTFALAVRHDADTSMVSADGDYAPLQVNAQGQLKVTGSVSITPAANEEYTVTDALAAGGDGLVTITAAATPWVTVASFSHTSGVAYLYGFSWTCDQNADARIITDDTTDIVVYKRTLNSSAQPNWAEFFGESGRIEIPGSASLEIKLQIKKRSTTGGNAAGHGSLHLRK